MMLGTIRRNNATQAARIEGETITPLAAGDVGELLQNPDWRSHAAAEGGTPTKLDDVDFAPLITRPGKIVCVGANYLRHIREMDSEVPEYPTLFAKFPEALIGAHDDIELPAEDPAVDWEAELTIVIGKSGRRIATEDAQQHIAGYTVANDISMRSYQFRSMQWLQGKTWENSTPIGPVMIEPTKLQPDARITTRVNGTLLQDSTVNDLLFGIDELIAYISTIVTLHPGDVILTGTPSGVGAGMNPQVYLQDGDIVETAIEGIGTLRNRATLTGNTQNIDPESVSTQSIQ